VHVPAAKALRLREFDVVSVWELGREELPDDSQLEWAADQGISIATFNVRHFSLLHVAWLAASRHHAGIVVCDQIPLREFVSRSYVLLNRFTATLLKDQLLWLPKGNLR